MSAVLCVKPLLPPVLQALAWCPWQSNLLATGGGTADKTVRFWNATSGQCMESIAAKSQVSCTSSVVYNSSHVHRRRNMFFYLRGALQTKEGCK